MSRFLKLLMRIKAMSKDMRFDELRKAPDYHSEK